MLAIPKRFGEVQKIAGFTKGFVRFGFQAHNVLPRSPSASVCTALLRRCQSASGTTTRSEFAVQSPEMSERFQGLQGAVRSTPGGQTRSPWAGARPEGLESRARAAEQGRTQRAARPAPAAPPTSPGPEGGEPPLLRSRRRPGPPPQDTPGPARHAFRLRCRGPDVGPAARAALTPCPGHPLAARPSLAEPALPPPELAPHWPPLCPPPGTSPAACSPACGRGGSCAERRAPIAQIGEGRDFEQD